MKYIGIQSQISRNNTKSFFLILAFPLLVLAEVYAVLYFFGESDKGIEVVNEKFISVIPFVLIGVGIWFTISYFFHSQMIQLATHSRPLERKDNMLVYNLTENLCMSVGMRMPKLYIIETEALNAFASGINEKTYAVTLTRGLINKLSEKELEGVIAHELVHIRNKDVRLLIVTIVFVGIFAFIADIAFRMFLSRGTTSSRSKDKGGGGGAMFVILLIAAVVYLLSVLFKLALSRKREYMADAGAVEMTRDSLALAGALRKISMNSDIDQVKNDEVKEMFIENKTSGLMALFSTHPPIEKRIKILEQF